MQVEWESFQIRGLHSNWKQRAQAQVPSQHQQPLTASAAVHLMKSCTTGHQDQASNTVSASDGDDLEVVELVDGGELGADEDVESLEAVRKNKQVIGSAKKYYKGGTKAVRCTQSLNCSCSCIYLDGYKTRHIHCKT